jgi:hypothetical protein
MEFFMKLSSVLFAMLSATAAFQVQAAKIVKPVPAKEAAQETQPVSFTVNDGSNRLRLGTRFELTPNITNVKDAIAYLVRPSGYKLLDKQLGLIDLQTLAAMPLPPMAQVPANMTIERALLIVIGNKNRLVVDHKNRLIGIEPMPNAVAVKTESPTLHKNGE